MLKHNSYKSLSRYVGSYLGGLKTHRVDINNQEWKYFDGGSGETILFLHGFAGSKVLWRSLMQSYVGKYRVIAVDIPGFCLKQLLKNKPHSARELANWLDLFLEHLQLDDVHLVAHSMGCTIASYFASTRPSLVRSVTLLNHPDITLGVGAANFYVDNVTFDSAEEWEEYAKKLFYNSPSIPNVIKQYRYRSFMKTFDEFEKVVKESSKGFPLVISKLRKIKCPVLTIGGADDVLVSDAFVDTLKVHLPWGRHFLLSECGHMCFIEKADEVIRLQSEFMEDLQQSVTTRSNVETGYTNSGKQL